MLFDWLYPTHFPVFLCCIDAWADSPPVTTAFLKFMNEFVHNRAQRLTFDASSPNGILLFREVSKVRSACLSLGSWSISALLPACIPAKLQAGSRILAAVVARQLIQHAAIVRFNRDIALNSLLICGANGTDAIIAAIAQRLQWLHAAMQMPAVLPVDHMITQLILILGCRAKMMLMLQVLVLYGGRVLQLPAGGDAYSKRYKGIWLCLQMLARALGGNYVNFGVFELYGDPALRVKPTEQLFTLAFTAALMRMHHVSMTILTGPYQFEWHAVHLQTSIVRMPIQPHE